MASSVARAPAARATPRPWRIPGSRTLIRISAPEAADASSACRRTVGTAVPAPSSTTTRPCASCARSHARWAAMRSAWWPGTQKPSPNIRMLGRATAPHRGHAGRGGRARIVASSIATSTSSADQVPSWHGRVHCSIPIAPWHSTTVSGSNPAAWKAPSTLEVNTRVGHRSAHRRRTAYPAWGTVRR